MERILKRHERERMKRAMLEQEETFRLQVHELHRLYRVQKCLMKEMKKMQFMREQCTPQSPHNDDRDVELEGQVELTLGIGGYRRKREEASSRKPESAANFLSSSMESEKARLLGHAWGMFRNNDYAKPPWLAPCLSLTMS